MRDYWRWSASNLLDNAARGVLAEFIVASALGVAGGVRTEWDTYVEGHSLHIGATQNLAAAGASLVERQQAGR